MPLPPLDSPELLKELDRLERDYWTTSDGSSVRGVFIPLLARLREAMGEMERLRKFREMIDALRRDEGESVEIIYDNPDFGGPNCLVEVHNYLTDTHESFTGETVDQCLEAALAAKHNR